MSDTIVAVSSPAGGVRSILRVTGLQALAVCERVFKPSPQQRLAALKAETASRRLLSGSVCIADDLAVDAWLYLFFAPHSYTGEDLAEIHVQVSGAIVEALFARLLAEGLRAAGPGEFTARAYLNGKLDLAQAEAVNEVISSSNDLQLEAAERLLSGRLTKAAEEIHAALLDTLSLIEAGLDFSGEDIEFISAGQAATRLMDILHSLEELLAGSIRYEALMDLPAVGIAGAPNAGKSSLLNALLGWERSIVSPQAKTTRDILTGVLTWEGCSPQAAGGRNPSSLQPPASGPPIQCVLFDCAGLILSPDNVLDELAQRAAIEALQRCEAVLFCVDSAKTDWSEDVVVRALIRPKHLIHVATKSDLSVDAELPDRLREMTAAFGAGFVPVSATKRAGLQDLVWAIESAVRSVPVRAYRSTGILPVGSVGVLPTNSNKIHGQDARATHGRDAHATNTPDGVTTNQGQTSRPGLAEAGESSIALTARHRQAVTEAMENVRQAIAEVEQGNEEVAVMMIRTACQAIAGIEQEHLDEQVLDRIFSRFCIGK